jgi:hypothetical protein
MRLFLQFAGTWPMLAMGSAWLSQRVALIAGLSCITLAVTGWSLCWAMRMVRCLLVKGQGFQVPLFSTLSGSVMVHTDAIADQSMGLGDVSSGTAGVSRSGGAGGTSFFEA